MKSPLIIPTSETPGKFFPPISFVGDEVTSRFPEKPLTLIYANLDHLAGGQVLYLWFDPVGLNPNSEVDADEADVAQTFLSASSRDFPVPCSGTGDWKVARTRRPESLRYLRNLILGNSG